MIPLSFWYLGLSRLSSSAVVKFVLAFVCYLQWSHLLVAVRRSVINLVAKEAVFSIHLHVISTMYICVLFSVVESKTILQ